MKLHNKSVMLWKLGIECYESGGREGLGMRLDKYLKVSRIIKRRTIANEACDAGRVMVNGRVAKASVDVKVGDRIDISFGNKNVAIEVTQIVESTKKEDAKDMFRYL